MTRTIPPVIYRGLLLSVLVLSASACSNNNDGPTGNTTTPTPPPVVVTPPRQEDNFGTAFGAAFRAVMDGEPIPVNDGDIVPVSLTTEPVNVS